MKIALQIYSKELNHPYDRRRLAIFKNEFDGSISLDFYTDLKQLNFNEFDTVIINIYSDLAYVQSILANDKQKIKTRFVFDYCDFIHRNSGIKFFLKTLAGYYRKDYSKPFVKTGFQKLLKNVDELIVGSEAQKREISQYNKNVQVISDVMEEIPIISWGKEERGVLWEGFANGNIEIFRLLIRIVSKLNPKPTLYMVTDKDYYYFAGRFFRKDTIQILRKITKRYPISKLELLDWKLDNLVTFSKKSRIAILPIPNDKMARMKPENKVVLMIRLGIYPIVSNIPSYVDFEKKYGLKICFEKEDEVMSIIDNFENEEECLLRNRDQIIEDYSKQELKKKWIKVLQPL